MTAASRTVDHALRGIDDTGHAAVNRPSPRPAHDPAAAARTSVALLPGRHEAPRVFEPLASRLALDNHAVSIADPGRDTTIALGETRIPDVPFVLLGSDTGALRALTLAGSPALRVDGLVLLGLPLLHQPVSGEPLTEPPPRTLPDLPILLVHGRNDQTSPLPLIRMMTRTAPRAELAAVPGGHGVLHGDGGRWAAARILLFLEALAHSRAETKKNAGATLSYARYTLGRAGDRAPR
ncbi:alpha/beta hydrolase [Frankia sp. CiP3]|uniref:alpha/beta hydrolase n=1 Tax=Frankia sp. CiP3 TaxID=2880971 RepID=UPI0035B11936